MTQADFEAVIPLLSDEIEAWPADAVEKAYPYRHEWLNQQL
jgi:hypothetical protein